MTTPTTSQPVPSTVPSAVSVPTPVTGAGPVLVVGPGARFLSGVSYYTAATVRAWHDAGEPVAVLLIRDLCPRRLYPGRDRVGRHPRSVLGLPDVPVSETLDWYWGPNLPRAVRFLHRQRPRVMVLHWWTGTTLHTYLLLAALARLAGVRVVVEFHETLDVAEAAIGPVRRYVRGGMRLLTRLADAGVVHSTVDAARVPAELPVAALPLTVVHHGPTGPHPGTVAASPAACGEDRLGPVRLLFFGVVRPYKGVDVLVDAFTRLVADGADVHLTVAGERWGGSDPTAALATLDPARWTRIDRYVDDTEVAALFAAADVVVLPYRRSAASGPMHQAIAAGLPVVISDLPSLVEAAAGYTGLRTAPADDPAGLAAVLAATVADLTGPDAERRHRTPVTWADTIAAYRPAVDGPAARRPASRRARRLRGRWRR